MKHKTIKPPTEKDILIAKFHACTGVAKHILAKWLNEDLPLTLISGTDIQKAQKIIEQYKMQEYSKLLIRYMELKCGHLKFKDIKGKLDKVVKEQIELLRLKKEMINFLAIAFSSGKLSSIQINKATGRAQIKDSQLIKGCVNVVTKEFIKREYNITNLTIPEAEKIFMENTDQEWFNSWMQEYDFYDEQGNPVDVKDFEEGKKYYSAGFNDQYDYQSLHDEMIHAYAVSHKIKRTLNSESIKQIRLELKEEEETLKNKVGSPEQNRAITLVAFAIADLSRIDKFISTPVIQDINKIIVSNQNGRFLHDIMACFGIIEDKSKIYPKSKTYRFTKKLLNNKLQSASFDQQMYFRRLRLNHLKSQISS